MDENLYNRAEKRVDEKIHFYRHLFSYVVVLALLFVANYVLTPGQWWFQWVAIFWGIDPIITWIFIAIIFAIVFWLGFFLYYKLLARDLNKKIEQNNNLYN